MQSSCPLTYASECDKINIKNCQISEVKGKSAHMTLTLSCRTFSLLPTVVLRLLSCTHPDCTLYLSLCRLLCTCPFWNHLHYCIYCSPTVRKGETVHNYYHTIELGHSLLWVSGCMLRYCRCFPSISN